MSDAPLFRITGFINLNRNAKITFELPTSPDGRAAMQHAKAFIADIEAEGFMFNEPGLEDGEQRELIAVVMRREKPADGTPIIDMYPNWGAGDFGIHKYVRKYLNKPQNPGEVDMVAEFLAVSGFKSLDEIPLYDGQQALKRTPGKRHPKEVFVPTPFYVVRHKKGQDKILPDGTTLEAAWEVLRYERVSTDGKPTSSPASASQNASGAPGNAGDPEPPWNADTVKTLVASYGEQVMRDALGIKEKFSEWKGGWNKAVELIQKKAQEATF